MTLPSAARGSAAQWSRGQRIKNDLLYALAAAALRGARGLPRVWLSAIGRAVGDLAFVLLGEARRLATDNIALVYPELEARERRRMARRVFRALGGDLGDAVALLCPDEAPDATLHLPPESAATLRRALDRGRGVVYATAHLGPWEHMAPLLCRAGFPIATVARESYDARFHPLVYDPWRARRGVRVIYRGRADAPFAIVRALRSGSVVGFPVDLPGRVPVVDVMILGVPSRLPVGPARVALRARSPVVVGTPGPCAHADGRRFALLIEDVRTDDVDATPTGQALLTQRIADVLTRRIRALPLHWPWMHPSFAPSRQDRIADAWQGSVDSVREGRTD
jgi:KDO2-lipid IV(A) lauroyltransferase